MCISGSVAQNWSVSHTPSKLCAVHHSTVVLPCKYTYPTGQTVTSSTWHYRTSKGAATEIPVVHSLADGLNCSLTLDSVTQGDAGFYQFSFRTSGSTQDLTNEDGVTLEITGEEWVERKPLKNGHFSYNGCVCCRKSSWSCLAFSPELLPWLWSVFSSVWLYSSFSRFIGEFL